MEYVFIVNGAAGTSGRAVQYLAGFQRLAIQRGLNWRIVRTANRGDAGRAAREACASGKPVRLYAFGGDGTFSEVAQEAAGKPHAAVGVIPAGSGNDFVRCFDAPFTDPAAQLDAKERPLDLLRLSDGRVCVNMANIGLDCNVAAGMSRWKRLPFVGGRAAYLFSLVHEFFQPLGVKLRFTVDGGEPFEQHCLLAALGNGQYCGGGFRAVPYAMTDDGAADLSIIQSMNRLKILSIVGKYHKGTHLNTRLGRSHVKYVTCKQVRVESDTPFRLCVDGEITEQNAVEFKLEPAGIRFLCPQRDK